MKKYLQPFLKIKAKNSQKGRNLVKNGQILNILELFRHAEYDFFKENYMNNFHTKTRKIPCGVWKLRVKNSQNCKFWPKMAKFWS